MKECEGAGSIRRKSISAKVVLPQPLSPTTAKVSHHSTEKLTLSTAVKRVPFDSREKTVPPRR
jgi:hypothetical protein